MLKQRFGKIMALTLVLAIAFSSVYAANYSSYKLPRLKGNNYTNAHVKVTNDKYITNKVTSISGTSFANFWAVDQNNRSQSSKYKQNVSNTATVIYFKNSSNLASGQNVKMAMENESYSFGHGFVSGSVDFR